MRIKIYLLILATLNLFAIDKKPIIMPINLGVYAKQYEIKEGSLFAEIKNANKDTNKTEIYEKLMMAKRESMRVDIGLPSCTEDKEWIVDLTTTAHESVIVDGVVLVKKGQKINPTKDTPLLQNIIVLNMDDKCEKKLWQTIGANMLSMVAKGNLTDFEDFENQQIGRANKIFLEKMGITCTPAVVKQYGEHTKIIQYAKNSFSKEIDCDSE